MSAAMKQLSISAIRSRVYREAHKDDPEHREKHRAANKDYYRRNKAKIWARKKKQVQKRAEEARKYYLKHKEQPEFIKKRRAWRREWDKKQRHAAIMAYGGYRCVCPGCDATESEFLSIDHIKGGGHQHRREIGIGANFFVWLRKNNYPPGYRVLCHNCNQARGFYGYCPHERAAAEKTLAVGV